MPNGLPVIPSTPAPDISAAIVACRCEMSRHTPPMRTVTARNDAHTARSLERLPPVTS